MRSAAIKALAAGDPAARLEAVATLRKSPDAAALRALAGALQADTSPDVREAVAYAFGTLAAAPPVREQPELAGELTTGLLAAARGDAVGYVRHLCVVALGRMPPSEAPRIIDELIAMWRVRRNQDDGAIHLSAVEAVAGFGELAVARLDPLITDPAWQVRRYAVLALGQIRPPGLKDRLTPMIDDEHSLVRETVKSVLAALP
jgi:HEAT repeat protein